MLMVSDTLSLLSDRLNIYSQDSPHPSFAWPPKHPFEILIHFIDAMMDGKFTPVSFL